MELFREYQANPSRQLRDRIFNRHYKLACQIAHQYRICCDEPFDDLLQLAGMGLLAAIERFDPNRGKAFSSFAYPYIKGEICHYLRDKSGSVKIPRTLQTLYQRGVKLQGSDEQIAASLGCSYGVWREAKAINLNRTTISIESLLALTWIREGEIKDSFDADQIRMTITERLMSALSTEDSLQSETAIAPPKVNELSQQDRQLVNMYFLQNQSLTHIRKVTGIKDVKSHLLNAALELCRL